MPKINYSFFVLSLAISLITTVLIMEYFFNIMPCFLCKMQRISYYLIIFSSVFLIFKKKKIFNIIAIICLFSTAIIAFYHMGIEYGFWQNIVECSSNTINITDLAEFKKQISVSCNEVRWKFILSLSGWNFLITFFTGILGIKYIE